MSKFYGPIGYGLSTQKETSPGVWELVPNERNYYGDIVQNTYRQQTTNNVNDDVVITDRISIVADPYALQNYYEMKYVVWRGHKWKIASIDASNPPRLIITLGGLYVDQN